MMTWDRFVLFLRLERCCVSFPVFLRLLTLQHLSLVVFLLVQLKIFESFELCVCCVFFFAPFVMINKTSVPNLAKTDQRCVSSLRFALDVFRSVLSVCVLRLFKHGRCQDGVTSKGEECRPTKIHTKILRTFGFCACFCVRFFLAICVSFSFPAAVSSFPLDADIPYRSRYRGRVLLGWEEKENPAAVATVRMMLRPFVVILSSTLEKV